MIRQASLASGTPTALETNGTVREARGLASITYSSPACTAYCTLSSPTTPIASAMLARGRADLLEHLLAERVRRQHAGAVAGVHAGLLDVLHDPADPHLAARRTARRRRPRWRSPGSGRGRSRRALAGRPRGAGSRRGPRASRRSPSRGRRARRRGARAAGSRPRSALSQRLVDRARGRVRRRLVAELARAARRSARGPRRGRSPRRSCRAAARPPRPGPAASFSGVCPPNCTITPSRLLDLDDREHVLERERLEVEAVGGVVVGGDRLGVAVDHHRVAAGLAHGHGGVHAAVVELDPLPDAVRARSRGSRPTGARRARPRRRGRPARALPARVVVGRARRELGGAGVDRLERALAGERRRRDRAASARSSRRNHGSIVVRLVDLARCSTPRRSSSRIAS